jgi:hypothetical protein
MRLLLLFLPIALSFAQQPPANLRIGYDSIQPSRLKADLTFVSSDALEGAALCSAGQVAIEWIASEFAKAGLKPAAGDLLQRVPLIEFTPHRELTIVAVTRGGQSETFGAPDVSSTYPRETSGSGGLVFAGRGITAPEVRYDDHQGIDVKEKAVLIFNHEPQEADANSASNGTGNNATRQQRL